MLYTTVTSKQDNVCIVNINRVVHAKVVLSEIHAMDGLCLRWSGILAYCLLHTMFCLLYIIFKK